MIVIPIPPQKKMAAAKKPNSLKPQIALTIPIANKNITETSSITVISDYHLHHR